MRLNQDCLRELLLEVESKLELNGSIAYKNIEKMEINTKFSSDEIIYHLEKLNEAGFLKVKFFYYTKRNKYNLSIESITWEGHKFLDTIRDDVVWDNSKKIVSKFSSVSITMISDIASNVISQIISKQMGI